MRNLLILTMLFGIHASLAQSPLNIAIINDRIPDNELEDSFEEQVRSEIQTLLQFRRTIKFNSYYPNYNVSSVSEAFEKAYLENDIVIGIGMNSSTYAISLQSYPKPTIASLVLDPELQNLKISENNNSGISNFTYLESPFDIKRDINLLYQIFPFEHLLIITDRNQSAAAPFLENLITKYLDSKQVTIDRVIYGASPENIASKLKNKKTAAYALPYFGQDSSAIAQLFNNLNELGIPSAAILGEGYISKGAFVGYKMGSNLQKIPRRIALNTMKIVEGQQAEELPVQMETFVENLLINMATARHIKIFPSFDLMGQATLVNIDKVQTDNRWTLQKAIAHGLQNNLIIRVEQSDINIAQTEISLAKSDMLPKLDASTSISVNDEVTTFSYQGALGRSNWILSGALSQVVFAEPILANIAIKELLKKSEETEYHQTQLDIIIDVTIAYMNILFAKSNLDIQLQNVERNKENFDIAKAKEAIGFAGTSDINRWEAELANANISLNSAYATFRQAKFQLNQLLNRPINELMEIEETTIEESMILIADGQTAFIDNYGKLDVFANFLVQYALKNLPELDLIDLGVQVQERLQLSRERSMYLPTIGLNGSANRTLGRIDIPEGLTPKEINTTWNLGIGISYPIFQGNYRKNLIEQSKLNLLQLQDKRKNLENQLELRVRGNIENVAVSYSRKQLAEIAAQASRKNFNIVQDAYSAGQNNITTLIDAQNNALASQLNATNAVFTLILDFLILERSIGYYNFLATPGERELFFQEVQAYFITK